MTDWHVDDIALRDWLDGTDSPARGASVEQHLLRCAPCRQRVGRSVRGAPPPRLPDLDVVWHRVQDRVEFAEPTPLERLLARIGLSHADARLVAAAPAFRAAFLGGVVLVLAFVAIAAALGQTRGQILFLTVAPLLPCVAVAFSYDSDVDPALEQEFVTPYSPLRLVLLRTVAVLAAVLPLVLLAGAVVPEPAPYLWVLPAGGFVTGVLALSTWTTPLRAAAAVGVTWFLVIFVTMTRAPWSDVLRAPYQVVYLALAAASVAVLIVRGRHVRDAVPGRRP
jgi:hypothetical protein